MAHPFGIGDAKYRLTGASSQLVDTVPFGAFKKSLWEGLGGFNEELLANEDYDFNYRVRQRGGSVLMDTSAHSEYFARAGLGALARQYSRYGSWKAQMVKLHPRSIRWRHLVAPAFVSYIALCAVLGSTWAPARWALLSVISLYVVLAAAFAFRLSLKAGDWKLMAVVPFIFFVMHVAWGGSFLLGLLRSPSGKRIQSKQRENE